ncbi:MAG TPA: hypothetical protein VN698_00845 [Bacteroidia bacterium]|nr:hypothetical protein [Bacteroidia bacterium]
MKNLNEKNLTPAVVNKCTTKKEFYTSNKNLLLILLSFVLMAQFAFCQQTTSLQKGNLGLSASSMFNADGYGVQYLPSVYYKKSRSLYSVAPIIQKQKANVSGVQLNYEYTIVAPGEADAKGLELFCFATGLYQHNALLGGMALHNESVANPEFSENVSQIHFKSVEAYAGFGLRIKLFKSVKWVNSIGAGGYASFNFPQHLYYAGHNVGLFLKTGISIDLYK